MTQDTITAPHRVNNFDALRILAAVAVLVAHSVPLSYGPAHLDALWSFSHGRTTLGAVAVQIFFIISGYLITASYINTQNPRRFLRARALRLLPALIVVLFLLAFILGPLLTTVPLTQYFRSSLPYRAALGLSDHLPGVFTQNPFSSGIDGSLWTLRYEALCYVAVLLLGMANRLRLRVLLPLFVLLLAARLAFGPWAGLEFGTLFAAGAVLTCLRPPLYKPLAIAAAILWIISLRHGLFTLISDTFGAYLVIYLGRGDLRLPNLAKYGDLSYGVYIYAWPIQQSISFLLGRHANALINLVIALPLSLTCAFLSWHFIEFPALRRKNAPAPPLSSAAGGSMAHQ
jgi:peptidoglycan/LPS O-acetylase OafA/YrhL